MIGFIKGFKGATGFKGDEGVRGRGGFPGFDVRLVLCIATCCDEKYTVLG